MEAEQDRMKSSPREPKEDVNPGAQSQKVLFVSLSPCLLVSLSSIRAWCYLVRLSIQRQARARQMVWIVVGLLVLAVSAVAIFNAMGLFSMRHWRWPFRRGPTFAQWADELQIVWMIRDASASGQGIRAALGAAVRGIIEESGFSVFSRSVVFFWFLSFLMPLWSLSFATEALGGERETNSLVWLLSRPLPRPAIYLAKYVALLPWSIGFNLGGFALLCLAAGKPGAMAFGLFWPAVLWSTLAFSSLFYLMGAFFRRPAVVAIVYAFFLEVIFGNMPGYLKRISIGFYTRCMMFEAAGDYGVQPERPDIFLPVDGTTAAVVLMVLSIALLVLGMAMFARSQYREMV